MHNYRFIENPKTNRKVKSDGKIGRQILKNYLMEITGGSCGYNLKTARCGKKFKNNPEWCELSNKGRCKKSKQGRIEAPVKKPTVAPVHAAVAPVHAAVAPVHAAVAPAHVGIKSSLLKLRNCKLPKNFEYVKQLGSEGKDGMTLLAKNNADGKHYAVKIFRPKKSMRQIQKEYDFLKAAAIAGLAPKVIDLGVLNENNKCFMMEALDKTLKELIKEQGGSLTKNQRDQIVKLYEGLTEIGILHNDDNVLLNIMCRVRDNKLFLIDFGMSRAITKKDIKIRGPNPNLRSIPLNLQHALRKTTHNFRKIIDDYENKHGVIIDIINYRIKQKEKRVKDRIKALMDKSKKKSKK